MLVLSRKNGESIEIGDGITITVVRIGPNAVWLGVTAPRDVLVLREELEDKHMENIKPVIEILERLNFRTDGIEFTDRLIKIEIHTELKVEFWRDGSDLVCIRPGPVGTTTDIDEWLNKSDTYANKNLGMNHIMWNDIKNLMRSMRDYLSDCLVENNFKIHAEDQPND